MDRILAGCLRQVIAAVLVIPLLIAASPSVSAANGQRYLAFVSDLHMSLGRRGDGWHPYEDFRWPNAFRGFLDEISKRGGGNIDLIIAGDLLELWQLPLDIKCEGDGGDLGCTVDEAAELAGRVLSAHKRTFADLARFAARGDNRVHFIPGNHDAALLIPSVWSILVATMAAADPGGAARARLVKTGVFVSEDGFLVAEHGHQIGNDPNRYKNWPQITAKDDRGRELIVQPWGERFVQKLFNEKERAYPIIDNLSPESLGARLYAGKIGFWGTVDETANFVAFNIVETTLSQKWAVLGGDKNQEDPEWDIAKARGFGFRLFAEGLPKDDVLRRRLLAAKPTPEIQTLRTALDKLAGDEKRLSEDQVKVLCDRLVQRGSELLCDVAFLGGGTQKMLFTAKWVKRAHLFKRSLLKPYKKMVEFVYGHTHQLETGHRIRIGWSSFVRVFNTGAFQRIMEEEDLVCRAKQRYPALSQDDAMVKALSDFNLESDFKPCYTVVLAPFEDGRNQPRTWRWYMPEKGNGKLVAVGDQLCHWRKLRGC